jgi:hypothetical protein
MPCSKPPITPFGNTELPGENTIRRAMEQVAPDEVRNILHAVYTAAKRKKNVAGAGGQLATGDI